ncbi:MAG: helix-turn-helix domain-containing protein [Lachnospiraceae bacterium]|nr:helix-turn-helix domain-containing protein [Lachnospiraceae bacterium]
MDQKKTGQFLKMLRNEKKMTQEQLAEQFYVSSRTVSRWETGSNLPDISLLVELADFYDVDVREIIDGERKSEMMNNETREVADKMAAYAGNEKSKLLRVIQTMSIAGVLVSLLSIILQAVGAEQGLKTTLALTASVAILILMSIITLYVTGMLEKVTSSKKLMKAIKITSIVMIVLAILYFLRVFLTVLLVLGLLFADTALQRVKTDTDIAHYNDYIHTELTTEELSKKGYSVLRGEMIDIWPEHITSDMSVTDYQYTYYNPWDPQYVIYMTADYEAESYEKEIERLTDLGLEDYIGIYTVTGEPEGYDIISMNSDEYNGFTYAMIPEGAEDNTRITYVTVWFCNYFLDLDVHKYIPDEYLLPGFNAEENNPYKQENLIPPEELTPEESFSLLFPDFAK